MLKNSNTAADLERPSSEVSSEDWSELSQASAGVSDGHGSGRPAGWVGSEMLRILGKFGGSGRNILNALCEFCSF